MPEIKVFDERLLAGIPAGTWVAISADQREWLARARPSIWRWSGRRKRREKASPNIHHLIIRVLPKNLALIV